LPPYSLPDAIIAKLKEETEKLALALKVVGLMNVQFAIKNGSRLASASWWGIRPPCTAVSSKAIA
jgi:hypothetical protein